MGDKAQARRMAAQAGVPVVPGSEGPLRGVDEARELAAEIGYPVMLKAAAGGGGRGMRVVREAAELERAYATCRSEALKGFGSADLYLEKFVEDARHVEVQVLGDKNGIRVHLGERDCSVQRRHQKLLEEAPRRLHLARDARRPPQGRPRGGQRGELRVGGHRGVPRGARRALLLHRDEHPHPGRAPGDGAPHRPGPGPRADPHRGGRAARLPAGRHPLRRATPSSAG